MTIPGVNILVTSFTKTFKRCYMERRITMLPVVVFVVVVDDDDDDDDDDFNASLVFCLPSFLLDFVSCLPLGC